MSEIFGKNLKYLREKQGLEQTELANLLGRKSGSSISEWEKGKYTPKAGVLSDIARVFNVSFNDLMNKDLTIPGNMKEINPVTVKIPILGKIACGDPILAEENIEDYRYLPTDQVPKGEIFILIAEGNSMTPIIPEGAQVLIRRQSDVESGEIAAVLVNGDAEATLKRIKKYDDRTILMPENREHDPIVVDNNNPARILGKAVSYTHNL